MGNPPLDVILFGRKRKAPQHATPKQCAKIYDAGREQWGLTIPQVQEKCQQIFGRRWPDDLTFEEGREFLRILGKGKQ